MPATGSVPSVPLVAQPSSDWSVGGAIAFTIFVVAAAQLAGVLLLQTANIVLGFERGSGGARSPAEIAVSVQLFVAVQVCVQLVQLCLAWWLAGSSTAERREALFLIPINLKLKQWLGFVLLLFAVKTLATMIAAGFTSVSPRDEIEPLRALVEQPGTRIAFLVTVVLAGLTEEVIFRGVLSRTLERTRLGFWLGAAVTSLVFAGIHLQYGAGGQFVVFVIGLTLSWIRARSGSLWPAVVCHSINNAVALLALQSTTR